MGRHRLPTHPRPRGPRHAAPRAPRVRIAGPVSMAATAVLVALPAAPASAAESDEALDSAGTLLGGALGTNGGALDDGDDGDDGDGDVDEDTDDDAEESNAGLPSAATSDDLLDAAALPTGADAGSTSVTLMEKNDSGVSGQATIDPESVVATASGLDPDASYVSFFYGATSSATNNNPCILDGTNPLPSNQTIGEWSVDEDGNGTLRASNPLGARYGLQAGTMSIRKVEHDFSSATALPVNPASYSLVACGEVQRLEVLDPVTNLLPKLPSMPSLPPVS